MMDRRNFLKQAQLVGAGVFCASATVFGGGFLAGCSGYRFVAFRVEGDRLIIARADLEASPYVLLRHPASGEPPIYLHRLDDGSFSAVLLRCTHRGCQVNPAGARLVCPCHGSEFTPTGEVLEGPADRPLRPYGVTADAATITIQLV